MKLPFTALLSLALASSLFAQDNAEEKPAVGYIQLINGIALESPTFIQFGALKMMGGKAMPPGSVSGMLGMYAGPYDFEVTNEACDPPTLSGTVELENGKTFAQIFYVETETNDDGETTHQLRATTLKKQHEHTEPKLSLVSLSQEPLIQVEVGSQAHLLNARNATEVAVELDQELAVKQNGETLDVIGIATPAHYIAFFYDRADGKGQEMVYVFNKQIVYEPLRKRKDDEESKDSED